jgi:hypothetical protein
MTLKELKTIVAMLSGMPDETEIIVAVDEDYNILPRNRKLQNSFMPDLKQNEVKLFTEVL